MVFWPWQSCALRFAVNFVTFVAMSLVADSGLAAPEAARPNILWIYIEDMNPGLGCYGDGTVATPTLDSLAEQGVLFEKCFVPAGVCSPTRSALITGRMQTTIGVHNHNSAYNEDTPILLPDYLHGATAPELFRQHGYETFNEGKDHYNFTYKRDDLYSIGVSQQNALTAWRELKSQEKPFFGQIQLRGGKLAFGNRLSGLDDKTSPETAAATLPPYYPKDEVFLKHWALHYDCIRLTDRQIGEIVGGLESDGLLDNTIVFIFSDHGCYLPRHKQFCYEGSLHVPLIILAPQSLAKQAAGTRRSDLISALDITATSLAFAGIPVPDWYDSKDLFAKDYHREVVIAAKDRMDFTIDRVRSIRHEDGMKYIRNFMTDRPYMQLNYRHGREYMNRMEELFAAGKLSDKEARFWSNYRPAEELYDLNNDPHELVNLAHTPERHDRLLEMRARLDRWIEETDDQGQYPEDTPNLRFTYQRWGDAKCINPEYDQFRKQDQPAAGSEAASSGGT